MIFEKSTYKKNSSYMDVNSNNTHENNQILEHVNEKFPTERFVSLYTSHTSSSSVT